MTTELTKADIIEAVLFAAEAPLPEEKVAQILETTTEQVREELEVLREEKARIGGLQIIEVAGGWQMLTKPELAPYVLKLRDVPRQKLSRAAFEVLAVVAYRQPITRSEVEALRGVDCSRPLTFLLEKKLLQFGGRKDAPGRPWLYETTAQFLDHFGLRSIADLPPLAELAEMNNEAMESAAQQLFSRGPMQLFEEAAESPNGEIELPKDQTSEALPDGTDTSTESLEESPESAAEAGVQEGVDSEFETSSDARAADEGDNSA